jgi:3-dehydroquinate synthase
MRKIEVNLNQAVYSILIGPGLLNTVADCLKQLHAGDRVILVTHPRLKQLYGNSLLKSLKEAGLSPELVEAPEGEESKSLAQASVLYNEFSRLQVERITPVLALGGGVIGDLAGFVAATYMRGIPLVQAPTTLLAQVDSSIGGKTAVNQATLKNIIGVFYQPRMVIADISALRTLPDNEMVNGMAEIIKYGVIRDEVLFSLLENQADSLMRRDESFLEEIVYRCASIKAGVTEKDEKDTGLRNILNFGHTVGHAVEAVSDFGVSHGNAVAMGMIAAARISLKMGIFSESEYNRLKSVIIRYGLPVEVAGWPVQDLMQAMQHDKKRAGGRLRMVLVRKMGEVFINDEVDPSLVQQTLEEMNAEAANLRRHR